MELNVNSLTLLPMGKSDNIYRWQSALLICPLKSILRRHSLELLARDIPTINLYGYVKFWRILFIEEVFILWAEKAFEAL